MVEGGPGQILEKLFASLVFVWRGEGSDKNATSLRTNSGTAISELSKNLTSKSESVYSNAE
jgi:hypothetical protein